MTDEQKKSIAHLLMQVDLLLSTRPLDPVRIADIEARLKDDDIKEWLRDEASYTVQSDRSALDAAAPLDG